MADSPIFEFVCTELEARTSLGRLEARGTVRLALKEGGLSAASVSGREMQVVLDELLPDALASRGIADSATLCGQLRARVAQHQDAPSANSPEAIFSRLGG